MRAAELARDLAVGRDPVAVLEDCLDAALGLSKASEGQIWLWHGTPETCDLAAPVHRPASDDGSESHFVPTRDEIGEILRILARSQGRKVVVDAALNARYPVFKGLLERCGFRSLLAYPLSFGSALLGVMLLVAESPVPQGPVDATEADLTDLRDRLQAIEAIEAVASVLATGLRALDNQLGSPPLHAHDESTAGSSAVVEGCAPTEAMRIALQAVTEIVGGSGAVVWQWQEILGRFVPAETNGDAATARMLSLFGEPAGQRLLEEAMSRRQVRILRLQDRDLPGTSVRWALKAVGLVGLLAAALVFDNRVLGVVTIGFDHRPDIPPHVRDALPLILVPVAGARVVAGRTEALEREMERRTSVESALRTANEALYDQASILQAQRDEVGRAREVLRGEVERLKELDQLKLDFLNAASHELRTPLTSIKGYAEFLEDELAGPLTSEQRVFLKEIQTGAERLRRIVDDMLDFARLEAGTFKIALTEADLRGLIAGVVSSLEPQARMAKVRLVKDLPADRVPVMMDAQRIEQVLINLVGNAIKFTRPGGRITVRTRVLKGGDVRVDVKDTGIGIPADYLGRIFQKFYQVDRSLTREHGGAGLGLAISEAIVEAHRGEIGVKSTEGKGATFWFTLPTAGLPTAD